jgi:hypothetical protein
MGGTVANSLDPSYLGAHTVAALLNAHASDTGTSPFGSTEYGLTRNQVIALYNTYSATKPAELKALFEIWNQSDASTRLNYQTQISQLGLTIPNP